MDETKHSPEPWTVDADDEYGTITDANGDEVLDAFIDGDGMCSCGDARRIVACVNYLRGISTYELERRADIKPRKAGPPDADGKLATDWPVWSEGACFNEGVYPATFHGTQRADTFAEACKKFFENHHVKETRDYFDADEMSWWGCRLFCNEADARKAFG